MSIMQMLLASGVSRYLMDKSLRFRASASAYLNRTPASAGNRQTWTWSGWIKRGVMGTSPIIFNNTGPLINNDDTLGFNFSTNNELVVGTGNYIILVTTQVFRDPSAWYHFVVVFDTTQATANNRIKLYVNGVQITSFSTNTIATYIPQNFSGGINTTTSHTIGNLAPNNGRHFDGYLADVNFIDGQALTPASFGETNALTGVWQPKAYTGTYGTNGFYLDFEDTSSVAALGTDKSGNGNTWTVNNISLTAGVTYDSMIDVPTLTSDTVANYAVLNPLDKASTISTAQGNLYATTSTSVTNQQIRASIALPSSGKFYWETKNTGSVNNFNMGLTTLTASLTTEGVGDVYYNEGGVIGNNGSNTSGFATLALNDIVGVAVDVDSNKIYWYKNNTLVNSGGTTINITAPFAPMFGLYNSGNAQNVNFGQQPFAYTPPTGFKALNTFNLLDSAIVAGNKYFDASLYTGNGSTQTITNSGSMQPDFVWVKSRNSALNHGLFDSVRGVSKALRSNLTDAEDTSSGVTSFDANGFTLGAAFNQSSTTFVGWQWKAGGAAVTNTAGTISSQVSANTTSGFSVVTFTGNAVSGATVGHGLGVTPAMVIVKNRDVNATGWPVYHKNANASPASGGLRLNLVDAFVTYSPYWNNTAPSSSVITLGNDNQANGNTNKMVAYCFAEIDGFSKFGSYTGNGSTDGAFIYTGFRPRFVMVKQTNNVGNWLIWDTARSTYNQMQDYLVPNSSSQELNNVLVSIDALSNGFKCRTSDNDINGNGDTYIYAAFAESPFKNSLAR